MHFLSEGEYRASTALDAALAIEAAAIVKTSTDKMMTAFFGIPNSLFSDGVELTQGEQWDSIEKMRFIDRGIISNISVHSRRWTSEKDWL